MYFQKINLSEIFCQKCPVYLKLPYLRNIFERFLKKFSEKINQVFDFVHLERFCTLQVEFTYTFLPPNKKQHPLLV